MSAAKDEFKEILHALIKARGVTCGERRLRGDFFSEVGHTVAEELRKVRKLIKREFFYLQNFSQLNIDSDFIRFLSNECNDFCQVSYIGGVYYVSPLSTPKSQHLDEFTRTGNL